MENYDKKILLFLGMVTDGADVMKKFSRLLQEKLKIKNFVWHHCSAHKLERVIYHGKRKFSIFKKVEKLINQGASFYKRSHVRKNNLSEFVTALARQKGPTVKIKVYKLQTILPIRWVSSSFEAHKKAVTNWEYTVKHLQEIRNPTGLTPRQKFDVKTIKKASKMEKSLRDKNVLIVMFITLDILEVLKKESLIFQTKGASLLGQSERQKILKSDIRRLARKEGGHWTRKFLRKSLCQKQAMGKNGIVISRRKMKCMTLERFSTSYVTWKGIFLLEDMKKYPPIISFIDDFYDEVQKEADVYMPDNDGIVHALKLLNHHTWSSKLSDVIASDDYKENINYLGKWFNMEDNTALLYQHWESLIRNLDIDEEYFTTIKLLNPTAFWENILSHYKLDSKFKRLVRFDRTSQDLLYETILIIIIWHKKTSRNSDICNEQHLRYF